MQQEKRGFTLIELLVVVLIIGILAAVALPQYQKAVDKSRVASIIPLMRRWIDAMALYKLENGSYMHADDSYPSADELGISFPSGWSCDDVQSLDCANNLWYCFPNENGNGEVVCNPRWTGFDAFIAISQPDDTFFPAAKRFCGLNESFCKSLGGKPIPGYDDPTYYEF